MSKRFAVIGNPVHHSLSPTIHQMFAEQTGIELTYEKILMDDALFEEQVLFFFNEGGAGLNITLPCKQRAFLMGKVPTPRCLLAKAANTLWWDKGMLQVDNTDGIGLVRDLARHVDLNQKRILLLGAGGAARGIIGALLNKKPLQLMVVNRTLDRAKLVQQDFPSLEISRLEDLKEPAYDVVINATSASLHGLGLPLPSHILKNETFCYDVAYQAKGDTAFVKWATERGLQAVDGLGMLVEQAAEAYFIWNKIRPEVTPVLTHLRE